MSVLFVTVDTLNTTRELSVTLCVWTIGVILDNWNLQYVSIRVEIEALHINQIFNNMHTIYGDLDYVQGYLRMGYLEMELNDEDFEKFKSLSLKEQKEWLWDEGSVKVDDFSVDDIGSITEINY